MSQKPSMSNSNDPSKTPSSSRMDLLQKPSIDRTTSEPVTSSLKPLRSILTNPRPPPSTPRVRFVLPQTSSDLRDRLARGEGVTDSPTSTASNISQDVDETESEDDSPYRRRRRPGDGGDLGDLVSSGIRGLWGKMKDGDSTRTDENLGWRDTSESPDVSFNVKEKTNTTRAIESTPTKSRAVESSSSSAKLDQSMITRVTSAPPVVEPEFTRTSKKLVHYTPGGHAASYFNAPADHEDLEDNPYAFIGPPPPRLPTPPPAPSMVPPKYAEGGGSAADFFGTATPGSDIPITPGMEHKLSMSTVHDSFSSAPAVPGSGFTSQPMYTGAITAEPISTPMGVPGAFPNDPLTPFGHQSQVSFPESFHTGHESNNIIAPAPPLSAPPMLHHDSYGFGSAYTSNSNVPDTQDVSPMHSSMAVDGIAGSVAIGTAAYLASSHGNGTHNVPPQPLYTPASASIAAYQDEAPIRPGSTHNSTYSMNSDSSSSHYNTIYTSSTTNNYSPQTITPHSNAGPATAAAVGLTGAAAILHQHQNQHGATLPSNPSTAFVATVPNQNSQYVPAVTTSNHGYSQTAAGYQTTTMTSITPSQATYQSSQYQSSQHYNQQQSSHPSGSGPVPLLASAAIGAGIGAATSHHLNSQSQSSNYSSNHPSYANQPPPPLHHTASINSINSITSSSSITSSASSSSKLSSRPTKGGGIFSVFGGGRKQSNAQQSHSSSGGKIAGIVAAGTMSAAALSTGSSSHYGPSKPHKPTAGYGGYGSSSPISQHTSSNSHTHHSSAGTGLAGAGPTSVLVGGKMSSHHASNSHHASHSHSKPSVSFAGVTGATSGHASTALAGKTSHSSLHSHHSHSSHSKPSSGLAAVTGATTSGLAGGIFSSGSTSQHQSSHSNSGALLAGVAGAAVVTAAVAAIATHNHKSHHNRPHLVHQASSSSTDSGRITSITGGRHNHNLDSSDIRGVHLPHLLNAFDSASSSDFLFSSSTSSSESSSDSGSESDETRSKRRKEKLERRQLKSDRKRHNRAQEAKRLKRTAETGAVMAGTAAVLSEYHSDDENKHRRRVERRKSSDSNLAFPHTGTGYSSDSSIYSTSANSNKGFFWGVKGKSKARRVASRESVGSSMGFGGDTTSPDSDSDGSGKPRKGKKRLSKKDSVDSNLAFGFGSYSTSRRSSYSSNLSSNLDSIRDEDEVDRRTSSSSRLSTERSRIVFPGHRTGTEEQHRADIEKLRLQEVAADIESQKRDAETISRAKLEKDRFDKEAFDRDRAEREKQRLRSERERGERERFENERRVLYEEQMRRSKRVGAEVRTNQEREMRMGSNTESGMRQVTPSFLRRISGKIR